MSDCGRGRMRVGVDTGEGTTRPAALRRPLRAPQKKLSYGPASDPGSSGCSPPLPTTSYPRASRSGGEGGGAVSKIIFLFLKGNTYKNKIKAKSSDRRGSRHSRCSGSRSSRAPDSRGSKRNQMEGGLKMTEKKYRGARGAGVLPGIGDA